MTLTQSNPIELTQEEQDLFKGHLDRVESVLGGENPPPYEVEIQPTSLCNLNCKHCFGKRLTTRRIPDKIHQKEMGLIANKINEFKENGFKIEIAKFCGTTGEPLLNPATVHGIELFKEYGKKVILFTNGLLLDRRTENNVPYLDYILQADKINLSLDAGSEKTFLKLKGIEGFGRIISSLEELVAERDSTNSDLKVITSYVIGEENYSEVIYTTKLMREIGVDEIKFRVDFTNLPKIRKISERILEDLNLVKTYENEDFNVTSVYSKKEITENGSAFYPEIKKCFNRNFWACIDSNLNLRDCGHRSYYEVPSYGSLLNHSFKELWNSKKRLETIVPDDYCKYCSPTSSARNKVMNRLCQNQNTGATNNLNFRRLTKWNV